MAKDKKLLTGGEAAVEALRQIEPAVFAAYPITPQTPIIEGFSEVVASGKAQTEFIPVESEHSAPSACLGALAMGQRAATATASQGLMLMHEILHVASGMRMPLLMPVVSRALSSPINIHCDHSDVMSVRDSGWLMIFCENVQEVYDFMLIGQRLAEESRLPVMVVQDGFITSHGAETAQTLADSVVKEFLGEYEPENTLLDFKKPPTFGPLVLQDYYMDIKRQQIIATSRALKTFGKVTKEYEKISKRAYSTFETKNLRAARVGVVCLGSSAGTVKHYISNVNGGGTVGLVSPKIFRSFDYQTLAKHLSNFEKVVVLERSSSFGSQGHLTQEVLSTLSSVPSQPEVATFTYGLGGADFGVEDLGQILEQV